MEAVDDFKPVIGMLNCDNGLGMDSDEVLRLKQVSGLLELFADRHFSQAWTVK